MDGGSATAVEVAGLRFSSEPRDGETYRLGEGIEVTVQFGLEVEVTGDPQLALEIGSRRVHAALRYHEGDTLWFRYVVRAGDRDSDGVGVPADALMLNGGTIRSPAGPEARLGLGRYANTVGVYKVDGS